MATDTAEQYFTDELVHAYEEVGTILHASFRTLNDSTLETLLLLSFGMFVGAGNVYQVIQRLGVSKNGAYGSVKNVSAYLWRQLLQHRLYEVAIPLVLERLNTSDTTKSRDGLILAVDDSVIARIATELGYVWKWWSGQLKRVTDGQDVIALVLVLGDVIVPLDLRIASKQGRGLKTKPDIYREMLEAAYARFSAAGIDVNAFKTTGDAAYLSGRIADVCHGTHDLERGESTGDSVGDAQSEPGADSADANHSSPITGIFGGKNQYVFEIEGIRQKAGLWKKAFREDLEKGWGTAGQPVYRTAAESPTFGTVILVFYIPKGKRAVSYLIIVGRPLRSSEALHAYSFHHRIEEFWKLLKQTLHVGDMKLQGRSGAHACVGLKVIEFLLLNGMKQHLRKLRRFRNVTINKLVNLCPHFVDMRHILKTMFPDLIPDHYDLEEALCR